MYIRLIRNKPQGNAITGRLIIDGRWFCNTLERKGYEILALCYHVAVTMSPKFKRLLPLVTGVPRSIVQNGVAVVQDGVAVVQNGVELSSAEKTMLNHSTQPLHKATQPLHNAPQPPHHATPSALRTGIRFHRGTKPEHSTGCILVLADNKNDNTDNLRPNQIAPHSPTRLIGDPAYPLVATRNIEQPQMARRDTETRRIISSLLASSQKSKLSKLKTREMLETKIRSCRATKININRGFVLERQLLSIWLLIIVNLRRVFCFCFKEMQLRSI